VTSIDSPPTVQLVRNCECDPQSFAPARNSVPSLNLGCISLIAGVVAEMFARRSARNANDGAELQRIPVRKSTKGIEAMTSQTSAPSEGAYGQKQGAAHKILTAKETATLLKMSVSWLAKARMRGDGPPFHKLCRSIRYKEMDVMQWMKSRQRMSTSEQ
jgi:predicted DNA-binding transcriptional regulator AlpA